MHLTRIARLSPASRQESFTGCISSIFLPATERGKKGNISDKNITIINMRAEYIIIRIIVHKCWSRSFHNIHMSFTSLICLGPNAIWYTIILNHSPNITIINYRGIRYFYLCNCSVWYTLILQEKLRMNQVIISWVSDARVTYRTLNVETEYATKKYTNPAGTSSVPMLIITAEWAS